MGAGLPFCGNAELLEDTASERVDIEVKLLERHFIMGSFSLPMVITNRSKHGEQQERSKYSRSFSAHSQRDGH